MISARAWQAKTKTGKKIGLNQALSVIGTLQKKNAQNEVIVASCHALGQQLTEARESLH